LHVAWPDEIKNPLTPIRLSAERIARNLLPAILPDRNCLTERQVGLVRECTAMIGTEVSTLQRMVDEFSTFARLPKIKLEPASINEVARNAPSACMMKGCPGSRSNSGLRPDLPDTD
jgi:nitrogen fixation/metabolism regulation signal transduction histidine kinase